MNDLKERFDFLTKVKNYDDSRTTGKNIRKCLKIVFPSTKFSIRHKDFSMGDSFNISYVDGPILEKVETITKLFDGFSLEKRPDMEIGGVRLEDFQPLFGRAKYVLTERMFSEEAISAETERVLENYKGIRKDEVFHDIFELVGKYGQPNDRVDFKNRNWVNVATLVNSRLSEKNL